MEWAASSDEFVIQQLNRRQDTNTVMIADARTGKARPVLTEKDEAWVDVAWGDIDWDKPASRVATSNGSTAANAFYGPANAMAGVTSIPCHATAAT